MADFDLVAEIRGSFDKIKRQAKGEKIEMPVQQQGGGGGTAGGADGGAAGTAAAMGSMTKILGTIALYVGVVTAMLEPLNPLVEMIGGILKILGMFLVPVMLMLMPFLAFVMKILSKLLNLWMGLNLSDIVNDWMENLVGDINRILQDIIPWMSGGGGGEGEAKTSLGKLGQMAIEPIKKPLKDTWEYIRSTKALWDIYQEYQYLEGKGAEKVPTVYVNVDGLTNESAARQIAYVNQQVQGEGN